MTITLGTHTITAGGNNYNENNYGDFDISPDPNHNIHAPRDFVQIDGNIFQNIVDTTFFGVRFGIIMQMQNLSGTALPSSGSNPAIFEAIALENFPIQEFSFDGDQGTLTSFEFVPAVIPEPASIVLSLVGLGGVGLLLRPRSRAG